MCLLILQISMWFIYGSRFKTIIVLGFQYAQVDFSSIMSAHQWITLVNIIPNSNDLQVTWRCSVNVWHQSIIFIYAVSGWWKGLAERWDRGFLASGGDEFNPGPETRLDCSELWCNKVLLKYKGDRESFWHRHQKGQKNTPSS